MTKAVAGKSRDAPRTRRAILSAAQDAFASRGYGQAGVREIAAVADVDPALVRRYFGSKERLFEAALAEALDIGELIDTTRDRFGEHIAAYLTEGRDGRPGPLPIMMMAMADPAVRPIAITQLHYRVIAPLSAWIGGADAEARAARVSMLCSGFLTYVRLLPLNHFSDGVDDRTKAWLAETLQATIDD